MRTMMIRCGRKCAVGAIHAIAAVAVCVAGDIRKLLTLRHWAGIAKQQFRLLLLLPSSSHRVPLLMLLCLTVSRTLLSIVWCGQPGGIIM